MLGEWGYPEACEPIKRILHETGGVIFFDGLDEVREADQDKKRSRMMEAIHQFARGMDRCKVIITCREYAYRKDDAWRLPESVFPVVELDLFQQEQIAAFTRAWYHATGRWKGWDAARQEREAANLAQAVHPLAHLKELAAGLSGSLDRAEEAIIFFRESPC